MKRATLCCIFALATGRFAGADEIVLYDGQKAETKILDTSGCNVVIDRNGRAVAIRKRGVDRIIMNGDTIPTSYVKNEKKNPWPQELKT